MSENILIPNDKTRCKSCKKTRDDDKWLACPGCSLKYDINIDCIVCLECKEFKIIACGHSICIDCINEIPKFDPQNKCPECRATIVVINQQIDNQELKNIQEQIIIVDKDKINDQKNNVNKNGDKIDPLSIIGLPNHDSKSNSLDIGSLSPTPLIPHSGELSGIYPINSIPLSIDAKMRDIGSYKPIYINNTYDNPYDNPSYYPPYTSYRQSYRQW